MQGGQAKSIWRRDCELVVVSALILFLELVLVRWIGTEVRVFAYLGNLVLVVCFFGSGLGCFKHEGEGKLVRLAGSLMVLVLLVANPFRIQWLNLKLVSHLLAGFEDSPMWLDAMTQRRVDVIGALLIVGLLTYLITLTFVPVGQILGRAMQEHPRVVRAYSMNIAGSLAGVWLFQMLSWQSTGPAVWFGVVATLVGALAILMPMDRSRGWAVGLTLLTAVTAWMGYDPEAQTVWSPYHKLELWPYFAGRGTNRVQQGYLLSANSTYYQQAVNLSEEFLSAHPSVFDVEQARLSHYNLVFDFGPAPRRVLIVGAGLGNNAAAALRHGAEQVDCVEIDPDIRALGRRLHPEHPYDSPRVHVIINDARAYFKQGTGNYDMIWFALLDSRLLGSAYTNLRLDHYVYTRESIEEAKRLLAPNGLLVVNFDPERQWIGDRLFVLLRDTFGHDPLLYYRKVNPPEYGTGGGATLIAGREVITADNAQDPVLRSVVRDNLIAMPGRARPTTDDWPYLYLQHARIPKLHWVTSLAILGTVALAGRRAPALREGFDWHFFALGAAFLLLEVQTVSRATLLFGMTWVVNAIVISAVLVMILLSNLVALRWPRFPQWLIVVGLALTVVALALVPLDWFNALSGVAKVIVASAFLTAPVFFAGLVFIRSFAACVDKSRALGSNLIGALAGGLLESVSFVTGIRALVILVGLLYLVALWLRPRLPAQTQTGGGTTVGGAINAA